MRRAHHEFKTYPNPNPNCKARNAALAAPSSKLQNHVRRETRYVPTAFRISDERGSGDKQHQDDHSTRGTGNNDSSFLSSNFCSLLITETPHRGDFTERNQKSTILLVDRCLSFCFLLYKKRRSAHLVEAPTGSSSCCSLHSQTCAPSCSIEFLPCSSSSSPLPPATSHLCLPQTWPVSLQYFLVYLLTSYCSSNQLPVNSDCFKLICKYLGLQQVL